MRWARPERAFCTCVRTGRRVWPLAFAHLQSHARPHPLTSTLQATLELHSAAVRSAVAASGRPQWAPALDGAARATRVRQLPSGQSELIHKLVR